MIWRIDEGVYGSSSENLRPIEIMRPDGTRPNGCNETPGACYPGSPIDAWDPGDTRTPQREMTRTWRNGLDSGVAVRAIPPASAAPRVFFDVRGPGVLVDPPPGTILLQPGVAASVAFPVRNTGEATDTFTATLTGAARRLRRRPGDGHARPAGDADRHRRRHPAGERREDDADAAREGDEHRRPADDLRRSAAAHDRRAARPATPRRSRHSPTPARRASRRATPSR